MVKDLPNIHEGASRWIRDFEERTQGKKLAVGGIKAILARMIGRDEAIRIILHAGNGSLWRVETTEHDTTEFAGILCGQY